MNVEEARKWGTQVAHSLNVVAELPRYVDDSSIPVGLRVAAVDAFFIHLRLLVEFVGIRDRPGRRDLRDIRHFNYMQGFDLKVIDGDLHTRLDDEWDLASKHVAHLSKQRVPTADAPIFQPVNSDRLRRHAADIFTAMTAFVRQLIEEANPYAGDFAAWLDEAERRRAYEPPETDPRRRYRAVRLLLASWEKLGRRSKHDSEEDDK